MIIAKHIGKRTPLDVTPEDDAIIFHKVTSQPIANILRGKMDADEFRDYILGFIFYNYLIGKMRMYAGEIASLSSFNKKHIFG